MRTQEVEYFLSLSLAEFTSIQKMPEGDRYVIEVVDWPGCKAAGRTRDDAGKALEAAKREWLISRSKQGLEIPLPRNVDAQTKVFEHALVAAKRIAHEAALAHGVVLEPLQDESLLDFVSRIIHEVEAKSAKKPKTRKPSKRLAARA